MSMQEEGFELDVGLTLKSMEVTEGWYRLTVHSDVAYQCPFPAHCVGGVVSNVSRLCSDVSQGVLCFGKPGVRCTPSR